MTHRAFAKKLEEAAAHLLGDIDVENSFLEIGWRRRSRGSADHVRHCGADGQILRDDPRGMADPDRRWR